MKRSVVAIVGHDSSVESLFRSNGYHTTVISDKARPDQWPTEDDVDLVCFTGGADIDPSWYGEENMASNVSEYSRERDRFEFSVADHYLAKIPMIGICRGGQLLNIVNGGKLIQDHGYMGGNVPVRDVRNNRMTYQRACHHQGIVPTATALRLHDRSLDVYRRGVSEDNHPVYNCFYPVSKTLCFQCHPEWGDRETEVIFFDLIQEFL